MSTEDQNKISTYPEAINRALWAEWDTMFEKTSYYGNGFQMVGYGLLMLLQYLAILLFRVTCFILFPLTAWLIIHFEKKNIEVHQKARDEFVDRLHNNRRQNKEL